jgi:two-component system alkaline phosphatase synthesis response regulator PhoP
MDRKKILIADDEADIRRLVKSALGTDYTVLEASNGEEAVDIVRSQKPDLVLMDIMMPKLDGIGACYILKSDISTRAIPIIMISVRADTLDQDYSREMGADEYLTKPFNVRDVLNVIGRLLPFR